MLKKWSYCLPVELQFGRGYSRQIGQFIANMAATRGLKSGCRVLLVGYRDCPALEDAYALAAASIHDAGFLLDEFLEVVPEPHEEIVARGADVARCCGSDLVVGLGGGSTIDTAKGIAALVVGAGSLWQYATANTNSQPIQQALPIVAVPTTAGTGAEATSVAVLKLEGVGQRPDVPLKAIVSGPALMPMLAIVDANFYDTMPEPLAAACGADALSHSIEVITSRLANPIATAMSVEAVRLLLKNLVDAMGVGDVDARNVKKAREAVTLATLLSGMAVAGPGVTAAHAAAHALGAVLGISHGSAVAMTTLPFLRLNAEACVESYARLAKACGPGCDDRSIAWQSTGGMTDEELAQQFVERIEELWDDLHLPCRWQHSSAINRDTLITRLAQNTVDSSPLAFRNNACKIDRATLERIIADIV